MERDDVLYGLATGQMEFGQGLCEILALGIDT